MREIIGSILDILIKPLLTVAIIFILVKGMFPQMSYVACVLGALVSVFVFEKVKILIFQIQMILLMKDATAVSMKDFQETMNKLLDKGDEDDDSRS